MAKTYYAGMEVEAPCGRCKGETSHRILTITDGVPEKLICAACNSVHKFRPEAPSRADKPQRSGGEAQPRAARAPASPSRFQELVVKEQGNAKAKSYRVTERWEEGAWMSHPSFGLGRVQKRVGKKVDVLFQSGLKTLISG